MSSDDNEYISQMNHYIWRDFVSYFEQCHLINETLFKAIHVQEEILK